MVKGFRDFLMKHSIVALAIGFIMGAATGKVVSSLVADVIMPFISLVLPGGEWRIGPGRAQHPHRHRWQRSRQCHPLRQLFRQYHRL